MKREIKNVQYEFVASSLKGYHEIIVSFLINGVEQKNVILIKDRSKWKDQDYLKAAEIQFNKRIERGIIKMPKRHAHGRHSRVLIALTTIFGVATLVLGGLFAYQYFTGGFGGGGQPGPKQKYTVTWLNWDGTILEQDTNVEVGTMPTYDRATVPLRPYDGTDFWSFKGWNQSIEKITNYNQIYLAVFEKTIIPPDVDAYIKIVVDNYDPLPYEFTFNYESSGAIEVDWDDANTNGSSSHAYTSPGEYDIKIKNVTNVSITNGANRSCVREIHLSNNINITSIPTYAFYGYIRLNSINIPNSVISIEDHAFDNCGSLRYVSIPDGLKTIGGCAFKDCSSLISINLPDGLTNLGCSDDEQNNGHVFRNAGSLASITIPGGVETIPLSTFENCKNLKKAVIKDGVKKIDKRAFYNCESLESIGEPSTINYIGEEAFYMCFELKSIALQGMISDKAFYECTQLDEIILEGPIESIGKYAFYDCRGIKNLILPSGLTSIYEGAFNWCKNLESVILPNTVTSIGKDAFVACASSLIIDLVAFTQQDDIPNASDHFINSSAKLKIRNDMLNRFTTKGGGWPTDENSYILVS